MIAFPTRLTGNQLIARLIAAALVVALMALVIRLVQRVFTRRIQVNEARYRMRKLVGFVGYLAVILAVFCIFSESLSGVTVALWLTGAGIALALKPSTTQTRSVRKARALGDMRAWKRR